eukprot:gene4716-5890_t
MDSLTKTKTKTTTSTNSKTKNNPTTTTTTTTTDNINSDKNNNNYNENNNDNKEHIVVVQQETDSDTQDDHTFQLSSLSRDVDKSDESTTTPTPVKQTNSSSTASENQTNTTTPNSEENNNNNVHSPPTTSASSNSTSSSTTTTNTNPRQPPNKKASFSQLEIGDSNTSNKKYKPSTGQSNPFMINPTTVTTAFQPTNSTKIYSPYQNFNQQQLQYNQQLQQLQQQQQQQFQQIQQQQQQELAPFSRIFIICGKDVSEQVLIESFKSFGEIESCKVVVDKDTNESKGYAYIKYTKTSSAALAIEEMNGKILITTTTTTININNNNTTSPTSSSSTNSSSSTSPTKNNTNNNQQHTTGNTTNNNSNNDQQDQNTSTTTSTTITNSIPIKVMIAEAKGSKSKPIISTDPEDHPPNSRLFVICKKDYTEQELLNQFKEFGNLEYAKLVRERDTNESKGCAFVKFSKSSTAAIAMETINNINLYDDKNSPKAIIAQPKVKYHKQHFSELPLHQLQLSQQPQLSQQQLQQQQQQQLQQQLQLQQQQQQPSPINGGPTAYQSYGSTPTGGDFGGQNPYGSSTGYPVSRQRLFVVCHKSITQESLYRLFSRYPGMEYCDLKKDKITNKSKGFAYVNYSTPQSALMAMKELNGIKYPPGHSLKVVFAEPLGVPKQQTTPIIDPISSIQNTFAQMPFIRRNPNNNDARKRQKIDI